MYGKSGKNGNPSMLIGSNLVRAAGIPFLLDI
jgi:hypothetical protein